MPDSLNDILENFQVAQQIRWVRVANRNARDIVERLGRLDGQLEVFLQKADLTEFSRVRSISLQKQVKDLMDTFYREDLQPWMTDLAKDTASLSSTIETQAFKRALGRVTQEASLLVGDVPFDTTTVSSGAKMPERYRVIFVNARKITNDVTGSQFFPKDQAELNRIANEAGHIDSGPAKQMVVRQERLREFIVDKPRNNGKVSLPEIGFGDDGKVHFTNGRNRFILARDTGAQYVPVAVDADDVARFEEGGYTGQNKLVTPRGNKTQLGASLDVITPNPGIVATSATAMPFNGFPLNEWISGLNQSDFRRTWSVIQDGMFSGKTTDEIVKDIMGTPSLRYKDGVREVTRRGARTLARTLTNHAASQGRQAVWAENDDIIRGVRWVATLDTRTTPICRHRDGRVGPVSSDGEVTLLPGEKPLEPPMARPPAHPNCRSTTVAITKSFRDMGFDVDDFRPETRASMDGKVSADLTYYDWLNKQSAAVQQDVLGARRYDLWKKGGVAPDRFVNDEGRQFTLSELKQKMPDAFREAGI